MIWLRGAARNTFYLKRLGVTHVLNTAEGNRNGTVNTNQVISMVRQVKIKVESPTKNRLITLPSTSSTRG